jgi:hypothetical protein
MRLEVFANVLFKSPAFAELFYFSIFAIVLLEKDWRKVMHDWPGSKAMIAAGKLTAKALAWRRPKKLPEKFSFCVGRPWPKHLCSEPSEDNICVYAYGSQVHYGSMDDAQAMLSYVEERTGVENFIYRLVRVA